MKFTFKTHQPTGRYRSFYKPSHEIKLKGKKCGSITHDHPHHINLIIKKDDIMEDGNPNYVWKWITLKKEFTSIDDAKQFLNENIVAILCQFKIHFV